MASCRHDLQEGTCGFCSTPAMFHLPRTDLLTADGPTVEARFPGTCRHCGQRYREGFRIAHVREVGWVCQDCLDG